MTAKEYKKVQQRKPAFSNYTEMQWMEAYGKYKLGQVQRAVKKIKMEGLDEPDDIAESAYKLAILDVRIVISNL